MDAAFDSSSPVSTGTTIIGVTYNGGVVLGADSRTSTGMYVANRASDKITQLTDNVFICRSGSAADTQIISDYNMLQAGMIVGGWDKYEEGKIYGLPLGGTLIEQPFSVGGSGSTYLYGFFDKEWKEGMTQQEAEELVVKAVSLAITRDGAGGGVVRTVTINSEGASRKFYPCDSLPLWHEELEPQNSLLDILASAPQPMIG
ncbi:OLC1v1012973C1 [Oldenlandia corymbosa var. corymbosa]|uniref:Proteasome subunit beta n=1 Tax=Oldenlandia corymbosa var. corymbosa TaxID=529605 RepID=A0AAV1E0F2_OLDCO|nr:OLC1v1012973C1 [Oldenlandia corymbosa var. corymbosa]